MRMRRVVLAALIVVLGVVAAPAALAHVEASPPAVAPDSLVTVTFYVPNERRDSPTVGLDLALPAGFVLDAPQQVSGWRTTVDRRADGTPTEVHWAGGAVPVGTFGEFAVRGRTPKTPGVLTWPAVQHYPNATVRWTGGPSAPEPAPTLRVVRGGGAEPDLSPAPAAAAGTDPVARSRAALGVVLGGTALLLALGGLLVGWARRAAAG